MSYPGYPGGYQQAPGGGAPPYPQQYGGAAPYPPYQQGGVFPPSLGFPANAPMYMPQPGGYPAQGPPYGGGYPPAGGGYPPAGGGYPPQGPPAGYPPQDQCGYPPVGPPSAGYQQSAPPADSCYPSANAPSGGGYAYGGAGGTPGGSYGPGPTPPHGGNPYPTDHNPAPNHTHNTPKGTPTVRPAQPFDPRADAEVLRKAMKGFGTDEKSIINVLARRTNAQRLQIALQFKTLYGKDLVKDLKSECSGNFENLLVALMTPLPQFYATELHDAISGLGTDEDVLIEVLCTMTNQEIRTIAAAYQGLYYRSLEDDLRGDTAGTFKRLMTSLCSAGRDESMRVDPGQATADAQALLQAGELRMGTDESTFNMILCQRNYVQLAAVFDEYQRITGHDIEKAIKNEFSGDIEDGMLAIIRSVRNRPAFFAKKINESMKGMGTNDRQLIRLIATRCEIDMEDIKRNYQSKYGVALKDDIEGDTSGHYKKCIWALIGEY